MISQSFYLAILPYRGYLLAHYVKRTLRTLHFFKIRVLSYTQ